MKNPATISIPAAIVPPTNRAEEIHNIHAHNAGAYRRKAIECRDAHSFAACRRLMREMIANIRLARKAIA